MIIALKAMICDEDAATMLEYGLLVGLVALITITAITLLGHDLRRLFRSVRSNL